MIKACVQGLGSRGIAHARALRSAADVELVGIADGFGDAAEKAAAALAQSHPEAQPPKVYRDANAMLEHHAPEVLCIALRPADRLAPIRDAIDAGVGLVFCEKPMATSWQEANDVAQAVQASSTRLCFCHQRRYLPQFVQAKAWVDSQAIGAIKHIRLQASNLFDWGTHMLDFMRFLVPDQTAASVMAGNDRSEIRRHFGQPLEKAGVYHYTFDSGMTATFHTDGRFVHDARLWAWGTAGVLEAAASDAPLLRMLRDSGPGHWESPQLPEAKDPTPLAIHDAIHCYRTETPCRNDYAHAFAATEMILAGLLAARQGGVVQLPLPPDADLTIETLTDPASDA